MTGQAVPDIERALEKLRETDEVSLDDCHCEVIALMDAVRTMSLGIDRNPTIERTYAALHALAQRVNGGMTAERPKPGDLVWVRRRVVSAPKGGGIYTADRSDRSQRPTLGYATRNDWKPAPALTEPTP